MTSCQRVVSSQEGSAVPKPHGWPRVSARPAATRFLLPLKPSARRDHSLPLLVYSLVFSTLYVL